MQDLGTLSALHVCGDPQSLSPLHTAGTNQPAGAAVHPGTNAVGFDYLLSQSPSQAQYTPHRTSHSAVLLLAQPRIVSGPTL